MNKTVKIILGIVLVLVLMGATGAGGYILGQQAGNARSAKLEQFISERMGNSQGTMPFASGDSPRPSQGGAFGGGNQAGGGQTPTGQGMTGVISSVSDDSIEITLRNQPLTVKLSDQTTVNTSAAGSRADLKPGETIIITSERSADGTLTASSIQIVATSTP